MSGREELECVLRDIDVLRVRRGRFLGEDTARDHPGRRLIGEKRRRDIRESVVSRESVNICRGDRRRFGAVFEGDTTQLPNFIS